MKKIGDYTIKEVSNIIDSYNRDVYIALAIAEHNYLQAEVKALIEAGVPPMEALLEWDLL